MTSPQVYAVVLNWNSYQSTLRCIESLQELDYSNLTTVLVDNGSTDNSFKELTSDINVDIAIKNRENVGFGSGMNTGVKHVSSNIDNSYIWILNNDVVVKQDTLDSLVEIMEQQSDIGILSPRITQDNGVYFEQGYINWKTGNTGHRETNQNDERLIENDYIPLCAALIRSEVFESIGYIPEEYFLYFEDIDFCIQAKQAGYRLVTDLETNVYHESGGSTGGGLAQIPSYYTARNRWLLFENKFKNWAGFLSPINHHLRVLGRVGLQIKDLDLNSAVATLRGWRDGIAGQSGKGPYP